MKFNAIKKLFPAHSTNIVRDSLKTNTDEIDFKHIPEELLQIFPHHQTMLRRRFSENFYKCLDIHRRPRLVKKSGELNIYTENVLKHRRRLFSDIFNTLLDVKWRWHFIFFFLSFIISWFIFATVWYMIAFINGDLKATANASLLNSTLNETTKDDQKVCVYGIFRVKNNYCQFLLQSSFRIIHTIPQLKFHCIELVYELKGILFIGKHAYSHHFFFELL